MNVSKRCRSKRGRKVHAFLKAFMTSPEKTAFYALPDDFPTPYAAHAAETSLLVRRGEIEFLGLDEDHYEETGERRLIFRKNGEAK